MDFSIPNFISTAYNIQVLQVNQIKGGWSALAYKITAKDGDYFLKVFDKHKHTAQNWIDNIDNYMPIVLHLHNNTALCEKLVAPLLTNGGAYKCENDDNIFILYPYVHGITLADQRLTNIQQKELAEIIAQLHQCGKDIPKHMLNNIIENFNVSFCDKLLSLIYKDFNTNKELTNVLLPYKNILLESAEKLKEYSETLANSDLNFVLCHTDLHGWNIMQENRLILLDWEGLKFAPAEADIFSFTDGFFFDYAENLFLDIYKNILNYEIKQDVLDFYRLRRRLEDITEFAESILYDNLSENEISISIEHLIKECSFLKNF